MDLFGLIRRFDTILPYSAKKSPNPTRLIIFGTLEVIFKSWWLIYISYPLQWLQCVLSKNKRYPGNSLHAWVNRGENTLLLNVCLATLTIWLCRMAVHFGFMCNYWSKEYFKHKKGSFLFSQTITLKTAEFKHTKICLYWLKSRKVPPRSKIRHLWNSIYKTAVQTFLLICVS